MMTDIPDKADLLPCPFCGGPAEHDSGHYDGKTAPGSIKDHCGHAIYCADMSCIGCPSFSTIYETEDEAIAAWNRRAALAAALPHMSGEPVAWVVRLRHAHFVGETIMDMMPADRDVYEIVRPLFAAPPASPDVAALIERAEKAERERDNARESLMDLQQAAGLALDAIPEDQQDSLVAEFLASIHRVAARGQLASLGATNAEALSQPGGRDE